MGLFDLFLYLDKLFLDFGGLEGLVRGLKGRDGDTIYKQEVVVSLRRSCFFILGGSRDGKQGNSATATTTTRRLYVLL